MFNLTFGEIHLYGLLHTSSPPLRRCLDVRDSVCDEEELVIWEGSDGKQMQGQRRKGEGSDARGVK